jgi:hypothetical protein
MHEIVTNSFEEVRAAFIAYLNTQGLTQNTINTAKSDTFYLWKKRGKETFWSVIYSADFENLGKDILLKTLRQYSKGDVDRNVNGYMFHLRSFRKFLASEFAIDIPTVTVKEIIRTKRKTRKMKQNLPDPCVEQVEHYLAQWDLLEDYHLQENALDKLFFELCPENKDISDVLLKVAALNDFYSTHIFKVFPMAKHIVDLDIDEKLKAGDLSLVGEVQKGSGNKRKYYSFATKYCSHHQPLVYPIYDSYVDKVLCYYRRRDEFSIFVDSDLKEYERFKEILMAFRSFYGLDAYSLKEIDKYIWQLGKDFFPRTY